MTISRRIGIGYAVMSALCLLLLAWLGHHEFVEEPREFAARGFAELHKDTAAELMTVCFLGTMPLLLALGWWWTRRALAPLQALARAAEKIESTHLALNLALSGRNDEVDTVTAALLATTARLEKSFSEIREFTLHASHELKTPLTVMRAELETVLRTGEELPAAQREMAASLLDETIRLAEVVDSLTLLAKADAGILPFERAAAPLDEIVREAADDAEVMGHVKGLKISLAVPERLIVLGDRHRLRQLLLILADNAVKYNREGGCIEISLKRVNDFAEVRIANSGGAISAETQRRLFQRFVRGENAVGRVEGCGLGLSIARSIAQAHGGSIVVEPGQGEETVAIVRLPLAAA